MRIPDSESDSCFCRCLLLCGPAFVSLRWKASELAGSPRWVESVTVRAGYSEEKSKLSDHNHTSIPHPGRELISVFRAWWLKMTRPTVKEPIHLLGKSIWATSRHLSDPNWTHLSRVVERYYSRHYFYILYLRQVGGELLFIWVQNPTSVYDNVGVGIGLLLWSSSCRQKCYILCNNKNPSVKILWFQLDYLG